MENRWLGRMEESKSLGYITRYLHDDFTAVMGERLESTSEKEYPISKLTVCGTLEERTRTPRDASSHCGEDHAKSRTPL